MGANSRLGTYSNKYSTPDPMENNKILQYISFLNVSMQEQFIVLRCHITFVHQQKGMNMSSYILHQFALNSEMEVLSPDVTNEKSMDT